MDLSFEKFGVLEFLRVYKYVITSKEIKERIIRGCALLKMGVFEKSLKKSLL